MYFNGQNLEYTNYHKNYEKLNLKNTDFQFIYNIPHQEHVQFVVPMKDRVMNEPLETKIDKIKSINNQSNKSDVLL